MMISRGGTEGPVVQVQVDLRAPPAKVFETWTRPELVERWFFAEEGYRTRGVEMALTELGAWRIQVDVPGGAEPTVIYGHFVAIEPGVSLAYTWTGACAGEQYWTLVTVRFEPSDTGGTQLSLTHGVFENDADRAMHEQGWFACLAGLGRFFGEPE